MTLTVPALVVLLALLTAVLLTGVLYCWPRVPGRRVVRGGLRITMLMANQLIAVLLVGVLANDAGGFYSSWSDLFRGGPSRVTVVGAVHPQQPASHGAGGPGPAGTVTTGSSSTFSTRTQWPVRGRVESVTIAGGASGLRSRAYLYLPPQYFQARYAHSRFPAVEVVDGYTGNELGTVPGIMRGLISQGRAQPMVLVVLPATLTARAGPQCTDAPTGPLAATYFADDVPAAIARSYRVRPTCWGALGVLAGGYCAVKLAMLHPDVFYAGAAISGSFTAPGGTGSTVLEHLNDLDWRLQHVPAPPVSVLVTSGTADADYPGARRFLSLVRTPMRASSIVVPGKADEVTTILRELSNALSWLAHRLPRAG